MFGKRWPMICLPLSALALLTLTVYVYGRLPYPDARYAIGDHYKYIAMAEHPFSSAFLVHAPPWCWRILTPWTVAALPLPTLDGFWLVTLLGLGLAVVGLFWFLAGLGLSRSAVLAATLGFVCLGPAVTFNLYEYMRVDALSFGLMMLALASTVHRSGFLLLLSLVLLALNKEVAIFAGIFAILWAIERKDTPMLRWAQAGSIAALLIYLALRHLITPIYTYGFGSEAERIWAIPFSGWLARLNQATIGAWGPLFLLALLHLRHPHSLWRSPACISLLACATVQIVISADVERVVIYAFPVILAASGFEIEYLAKRWHCSQWLLWGPVFALELAWRYTYAPVYWWTLAPAAQVAVTGLLWLLLAGLLLWQRRNVLLAICSQLRLKLR